MRNKIWVENEDLKKGCTEENYIKLLKIMYKKSAEIKNANGGNASGVMSEALKIIKNNPEYTTFIVWFDNDKFYNSDNNVLDTLSKKAKVIQSYPLKDYQKNNCTQLKNNIDEIKINLSKSNYPKYTGNIEEILNKFI